MNSEISVEWEWCHSWASCLSLLLSRLLVSGRREWMAFTCCFRQWCDILLFRLELQFPSVNRFTTRQRYFFFWYSVSLASRAKKKKRLNISTKSCLHVAADIIRDVFSLFFCSQYSLPAVWSSRDSLCVFIFLNRKQRNGSESEYTEKLQQYSKSLYLDALPFCITLNCNSSILFQVSNDSALAMSSSHSMLWLDHLAQ